MENKSKYFLTEFVWLIVALVLTIIISVFLFGLSFLRGYSDLHFHDTYFVVSRWLVLVPLFLLVFFLIYTIKEKRNSFSHTIPNWLTIISGLILIILLTILSQVFARIMSEWTIYPPLSASGNWRYPEITTNPIAEFIANSLIVLQIIVLTIIIYFTYSWGKQRSLSDK